MVRLAIGTRWRIVALRIDAGWSLRRIAGHLNVSLGGVRCILRIFEETDDVVDRPRSGRPRVTDQEDDNYVIEESRQHPFDSAETLRNRLRDEHHVNASLSTISRRLRAGGLRSYRPFRCPPLSPEHRATRLQWAQQHQHWSALRQWRHVVFSDESRFCVFHLDGRLRVRRSPNTRYSNESARVHVTPFGGGSIMVWGAISWNHKSALVVIDGNLTGLRYLEEILQNVAIPFGLESVGPGFIYQDDNARPHRARIVTDFHEQNMDYVHMSWPSRSPDMNPIEHAWDQLGRSVYARNPRNLNELRHYLMEEWDNLPQYRIRRLIRSMRRRCDSVIAAGGGMTRY